MSKFDISHVNNLTTLLSKGHPKKCNSPPVSISFENSLSNIENDFTVEENI